MGKAAVLTGDLIDSTLVQPEIVDQAMNALVAASRKISEWAGADTRFTRFRGDGWQIYLADTRLVLRATLLLLASLKCAGSGLATRLSIAVDTVERLGDVGLSKAAGPAFTLSGRNLDGMPVYGKFTYAEPAKPGYWKPATLDLAVWQATRWTPEQAEAVALALDLPRPTDEALAKSVGISRQAFQSRLKGSGIAAMSCALLAFETDSTGT